MTKDVDSERAAESRRRPLYLDFRSSKGFIASTVFAATFTVSPGLFPSRSGEHLLIDHCRMASLTALYLLPPYSWYTISRVTADFYRLYRSCHFPWSTDLESLPTKVRCSCSQKTCAAYAVLEPSLSLYAAYLIDVLMSCSGLLELRLSGYLRTGTNSCFS